MTTLVKTVIAANFMASAAQVERLASQVSDGQEADGTYLRILIAHIQSRLGRPRPVSRRRAAQAELSALELLDAIHTELYAAVLRGVGPEDMDGAERRRRATFARSAASTIRYFIGKGGDIRTVIVGEVTKNSLRKAVQPAPSEAPEGETRVGKSFRKAGEAVLQATRRLVARGDPEDLGRIEELIEQLEGILAEVEAGVADTQVAVSPVDTTVITGHQLKRAPAHQRHHDVRS